MYPKILNTQVCRLQLEPIESNQSTHFRFHIPVWTIKSVVHAPPSASGWQQPQYHIKKSTTRRKRASSDALAARADLAHVWSEPLHACDLKLFILPHAQTSIIAFHMRLTCTYPTDGSENHIAPSSVWPSCSCESYELIQHWLKHRTADGEQRPEMYCKCAIYDAFLITVRWWRRGGGEKQKEK